MIVSIDPGQTTGVALGDEKGKLLQLKQVEFDKLPEYLNTLESVDLFIVEEFRIRPDKAMSFTFSDMKTIQCIGMVRMRAYQLNAQLKLQRPLDKNIGYRWAGLTPPKNHPISHQVDAHAHLVFHWVHTLGLAPPVSAKLKPVDSTAKST